VAPSQTSPTGGEGKGMKEGIGKGHGNEEKDKEGGKKGRRKPALPYLFPS